MDNGIPAIVGNRQKKKAECCTGKDMEQMEIYTVSMDGKFLLYGIDFPVIFSMPLLKQ